MESCYGDLLGYLILPDGGSSYLGTLVGYGSGLGQKLCSPYRHSFSCNAYGALTVCQEFLGFFLFYLLPPGGPQLGGRCLWFFAVLDGAGGIFGKSFYEFAVCTSSTGAGDLARGSLTSFVMFT